VGFKISFKSSALKDLKKIDKAQVDNILERIDRELSENADMYPHLAEKFGGLKKFRAGQYRVIYTLIEDTVLILRISHREDDYR
jgi:mRNA interferase RelE/StbE